MGVSGLGCVEPLLDLGLSGTGGGALGLPFTSLFNSPANFSAALEVIVTGSSGGGMLGGGGELAGGGGEPGMASRERWLGEAGWVSR